LASAKKIDVAVLEYGVDGWTKDLSAALKRCGVPSVYMAPQLRSSASHGPVRDHVIMLAGTEQTLN